MRLPSRSMKKQIIFNITPLIDVVFLLIIFFLAASHLARTQSMEPVELPTATQAEQDELTVPRRLVITVTADTELHVGGNVVSFTQVEQMIQGGTAQQNQRALEVRIRADRNVPYGEIEPLLLACAKAGHRDIGFAVMPD